MADYIGNNNGGRKNAPLFTVKRRSHHFAVLSGFFIAHQYNIRHFDKLNYILYLYIYIYDIIISDGRMRGDEQRTLCTP